MGRRLIRCYKNIISVIFIIVLFAIFVINIAEAAANYIEDDSSDIKSIVNDLENVDTVTHPFINLNGLYQTIIQRKYIYDADSSNDLIVTKDNQLVSVSSPVSTDELEVSASELKQSSDWLAEQGIPLLYIQAYTKMCLSEEDPMPGLTNYSYGKIECFITKLREKGVDCIDARSIINKPASKTFYKTDHHWKNDVCFDLVGGVYRHLNDAYDFRIPGNYYSQDSFKFDVHKKSFLGAEGRRTGILSVGLDDFVEIKPKFETSFDVDISDKEALHNLRSGSFEEAIMDKSKDLDHYSFDDSAYYVYWGGDYGRIHVINNYNRDAKKVMIIKDSYAIPLSALMTTAFSSMDIIDIRYYNENKSIRDIVTENQPDAVIFIYGTGYLTKDYMFKL